MKLSAQRIRTPRVNGSAASVSDKNGQKDEEEDELFGAAVDVVHESGQASVSMLQRRLKAGLFKGCQSG
jgi:DNA segregation ATPase FtsK/SpoIIIE-like protein